MKFQIKQDVTSENIRVPAWCKSRFPHKRLISGLGYTMITFREEVVKSTTVRKALESVGDGPLIALGRQFTRDASELLDASKALVVSLHCNGFWNDASYQSIRSGGSKVYTVAAHYTLVDCIFHLDDELERVLDKKSCSAGTGFFGDGPSRDIQWNYNRLKDAEQAVDLLKEVPDVERVTLNGKEI